MLGILAALVVAGVALRLALMLAFTPAYLAYPDTWGYVKAARGPLFMDDWIRPAGYPAFLAALHAVWGSLTFAIAVQHVLGVATALLAYATVRRLGGPRWVALVPAAVILLCLDVIYFEQTLLSEALFGLLAVGSLYTLARSLDGGPVPWAVAAGLLAALATTVRGAGLFAIPVLVLVALLAPRRRLPRAGAVAIAAAAVLLGYAALNQSQTGTFGLTEGSGWGTYSRAAPFADCRVFDPPPGTKNLCESTDVRDRGTPDDYSWGDSPARRLYGGPPHRGDLVGSWGRAAIRAQPRAYLEAVASDLWSFVSPSAKNRHAGPLSLELDRHVNRAEALNRTQVAPYYGPYTLETRGARTFGTVQRIVRVHGALVLLALLLSLLALPFASARERLAILLLGGSAVVPVVLATATTVYTWRYAVPVLSLLMASGALGAHVLARRISGRVAPGADARPEAAPSGPKPPSPSGAPAEPAAPRRA